MKSKHSSPFSNRSFRMLLPAAACVIFPISVFAEGGKNPTDGQTAKERAHLLHKATTQLRSTNFKEVNEAVKDLKTFGAKAIPALQSLYYRGNWARRRAALFAFGEMKLPETADWLYQQSLAEPLQGLRRTAAWALTQTIGRQPAMTRYINALNLDPKTINPRERPKVIPLTKLGMVRAVDLLAYAGGKESGPELKKFLTHANVEVAAAAAEALGALGNLEYGKDLIQLLAASKQWPKERATELAPSLRDALQHLTGKKHGFNLLKWEQWQSEREDAQDPDNLDPKDLVIQDSSESLSSFVPKDYDMPVFNDPYKTKPLDSLIDLVIIFDTTGSMSRNRWVLLSTAMEAVFGELTNNTPSPRMGAIRYRAADPRMTLTYQIQPLQLTRDTKKMRNDILDTSFGGGSGGLHLALKHAAESFRWRSGARRILWVVGDVTPSEDGLRRCVNIIREVKSVDNIQVNTLYFPTKIHGYQHGKTYRILAEIGGGHYYYYDKAEQHLVEYKGPIKQKRPPAELPKETLKKLLTPKNWKLDNQNLKKK